MHRLLTIVYLRTLFVHTGRLIVTQGYCPLSGLGKREEQSTSTPLGKLCNLTTYLLYTLWGTQSYRDHAVQDLDSSFKLLLTYRGGSDSKKSEA